MLEQRCWHPDPVVYLFTSKALHMQHVHADAKPADLTNLAKPELAQQQPLSTGMDDESAPEGLGASSQDRIEGAAQLASAAQPTGHTLQTTQVGTKVGCHLSFQSHQSADSCADLLQCQFGMGQAYLQACCCECKGPV